MGGPAAVFVEPRITPHASDFSVGETSMFHLPAQESLQGVNKDGRRGHESRRRHTQHVLLHLSPHLHHAVTEPKVLTSPAPLRNQPRSAELTVPLMHVEFSTLRKAARFGNAVRRRPGHPLRRLRSYCAPYLDPGRPGRIPSAGSKCLWRRFRDVSSASVSNRFGIVE